MKNENQNPAKRSGQDQKDPFFLRPGKSARHFGSFGAENTASARHPDERLELVNTLRGFIQKSLVKGGRHA